MDTKIGKLYQKLYNITDHTPCLVDTPKRIGAYLADWVIGGILTGLPGVFIYAGLTKKSDMFGGFYVFESLGYSRMWAVLTGVLCIIFALFYYVYVPWKIYPGQTLGKKWAGFKITKLDGSAVDLKTLFIRQVICIFLLEGAVLIVSNYIRQLTTLTLSYYVDYYWQIFGMIMMALSAILIVKTDSHRAIHDYIAKTKLVLVQPNDAEKKQTATDTHHTKASNVSKQDKKQTKEASPRTSQTGKQRLVSKKNKKK